MNELFKQYVDKEEWNPYLCLPHLILPQISHMHKSRPEYSTALIINMV